MSVDVSLRSEKRISVQLLASFEVQLIKLNWLYDLVDTNLVESRSPKNYRMI